MTVRHNVDGNRGKRVLAKRGIAYGFPTSSTTLDEVAFKMIVSDAADRQRFLTKADVKSAYTNAWTSRGKRFLKCPDTAQEFDEDPRRGDVALGVGDATEARLVRHDHGRLGDDDGLGRRTCLHARQPMRDDVELAC